MSQKDTSLDSKLRGKKKVKLWHDDIRNPLDGSWLWARTNDEAKKILEEYDVIEISLDHDLGLEKLQSNCRTICLRGNSPNGTGYDLVKWMCANDHVPEKATVHSWYAPGGERMVKYLKVFGCKAVYIPYRFHERIKDYN